MLQLTTLVYILDLYAQLPKVHVYEQNCQKGDIRNKMHS